MGSLVVARGGGWLGGGGGGASTDEVFRYLSRFPVLGHSATRRLSRHCLICQTRPHTPTPPPRGLVKGEPISPTSGSHGNHWFPKDVQWKFFSKLCPGSQSGLGSTFPDAIDWIAHLILSFLYIPSFSTQGRGGGGGGGGGAKSQRCKITPTGIKLNGKPEMNCSTGTKTSVQNLSC